MTKNVLIKIYFFLFVWWKTVSVVSDVVCMCFAPFFANPNNWVSSCFWSLFVFVNAFVQMIFLIKVSWKTFFRKSVFFSYLLLWKKFDFAKNDFPVIKFPWFWAIFLFDLWKTLLLVSKESLGWKSEQFLHSFI